VGSIIYIVIDLILIVPRTIYLHHSTIFVVAYLINAEYMLYELRTVYYLMQDLKEGNKNEDEESDPNTDTVVIEAEAEERAATPNSAN
jgi:hypothetical protein